MRWIEYDYTCNANKGVVLHKKVEYSDANIAIAQAEALNGYTITEDSINVETKPIAIGLGGTGAKDAAGARENLGAAAKVLTNNVASSFGLPEGATVDDAFLKLIGIGTVTDLVIEKVITSKDWTAPKAKRQWFKVLAVGGGGGGGRGGSSNTGGGGGGGGYVEVAELTIPEGTVVSIVCGAGGKSASANYSAGGKGGTTSFGDLLSATGGGAGGAGVENQKGGNGGSGGAGGGAGMCYSDSYKANGGAGGTYGGGGGAPRNNSVRCGTGGAGGLHGGGGGGSTGGAGGTYGGKGGTTGVGTAGTPLAISFVDRLGREVSIDALAGTGNTSGGGGHGGRGGDSKNGYGGGGGGGYGGDGGYGLTSGGGGGNYGGNGGNGVGESGRAHGGGGGGGLFCNGADGASTSGQGGGGGGIMPGDGGTGGSGGCYILYFKED